MASYSKAHDRPLFVLHPNETPLSITPARPAQDADGWLTWIVAAIVTAGMVATIFPSSFAVGDGARLTKMQTFAPGPVPVTERRPRPYN